MSSSPILRKIKYALRFIPDTIYIQIYYFSKFKRFANLKNPQTYSEKLNWLKLHDRNPLYTKLVDKYEVKRYVAETLGENYVIPTLGVWNQFNEIDFDKLPDQFVLKCTHDSEGLVIVKDKNKLDKKSAKEKIETALKVNFFYIGREWPYKNVPNKILAEEYLENSDEGLHDYKVWCFNGEPVFIQYITGRIGKQTYEGFYDLNWNLQNFSYRNPIMKEPVKKPFRLKELIYSAKTLAKSKSFVRADFYVLEDGSIKFGEITFYPLSGMQEWQPNEMDKILGELLELQNDKIYNNLR